MKLEKERNCIRITYTSDVPVNELTERFEKICSETEGIYLPPDVQKAKEGVVLNVRNRESLKAYLEKNIFRMDDYIELLKRIGALCTDLSQKGYDPGRCIWDVDAVFIGNSVSDIEVIYPEGSSEEKTDGNLLADFLAVSSLHVFDSRDNAIDALSEVVRDFSLKERNDPGYLRTSGPFDRAINALSPYASGSGVIRQYLTLAAGKIKRLIGPGPGKKAEERKPEKPGHTVITTKSDKISSLLQPMKKVPEKLKSNGSLGVESRRIDYDPEKKTAETAEKSGRQGKNGDRILEKTELNRKYVLKQFGKNCLFVSRSHALLLRDGKKYILTDCGSVNGTFLNGEIIKAGAFYKLTKGDVISLAHKELSLCLDR